VQEVRRIGILEAMAEAMAERGAGASTVTVAEVIERAGVASDDFVQLFSDREACLLAAFELGVRRAAERVVPAYEAESGWLDAIKAGLASFLRFLEDEPALGRLIVVHAAGGGPVVLLRRMHVLTEITAVIDAGRDEAPLGKRPPSVLAEGVVGAVGAILQNRLLTEDSAPLTDLFGALAGMIVLPYLGSAVARREIGRPAPRIRARQERGSDPQRLERQDPGARLTYRTARALAAIEDYPGASNREIAERAGIVDQGQISKLLSRLEASRLIENIGEGKARGAPNSWQLSADGEALMRSAEMSSIVRSSNGPVS
jgi:AcrR family transcriptional regulator